MKCTFPWFRLDQTAESRSMFGGLLARLRSAPDLSKLCSVSWQRDPLLITVDVFDTACRFYPSLQQLSWVQVPCGKCASCKQTSAQTWADRLLMELPYTSRRSSFITLTYDDAHLPLSYTLSPWSGSVTYVAPYSVRDWQLFMKLLRAKTKLKDLRFLACAEYGGRSHRPHFHAGIVGYMPEDLKFYKTSSGRTYYTSESLSEIWQCGNVVVTDLTPGSGAYVARYMTEKWDSRDYKLYSAEAARLGFDPLPAPKLIMSRRPGLGRRYLEEHVDAVLRDDLVIPNRGSAGSRVVPSFRYALSLLSEDQIDDLKARRAVRVQRQPETSLTLTQQCEVEALRMQRFIDRKSKRNSL